MLDYIALNKKKLNIKLVDGTELKIFMPKKKLFTTLNKLQNEISSAQVDDFDKIDTIYQLTAEILSNNSEYKKISEDYLSDIFDFEDITIFFTAYMQFVTGVNSDPN